MENIRNFGLIFVLLALITLPGCGEDPLNLIVDCSECYQQEPDSAELILDFTINEVYDSVPFTIYRGKVEDGNIEFADTATAGTWYVYVPVNKFYSVEAKYKSGNKTIIAIDGEKLRTRLVVDECDRECYVIRDGKYDLKLKE